MTTPLPSVSRRFSAPRWEVTTAETTDDALTMREQGAQFDVIISDIEMPGKDGFEFAKDVRGDSRWQDVPMVAISGHSSDDDFQRGSDAFFKAYVAKSHREEMGLG